jgi:hypothetical protein
MAGGLGFGEGGGDGEFARRKNRLDPIGYIFFSFSFSFFSSVEIES